MILKQKLRKVEKKTKKGWVDTEMKKLKNGDVFRLFEPDGSKVCDNHGRKKWVVKDKPFQTENGVWKVQVAD